jgi:DNA-binding NarL/FixJ family response regulator
MIEMNRNKEYEVNYLSKIIKDNTNTNFLMTDEQLQAICTRTKLEGEELLKASLQLLTKIADYYAKQSVKINTLEKELKAASGELSLLRSTKLIKHNELIECRMKNGGITTYRHDASKELVNYYVSKGVSNEEIAKELGISESTVWRRKKEYEKALQKRLGI